MLASEHSRLVIPE